MDIDLILRAARDPLMLWEGKVSPPQGMFHKSRARKRIFRAANKVGKSISGAAEAWWHLLGCHPWRDTQEGTTGLVLVPDLQSGWLTISRCLKELEPEGVLHEACYFVDGVGYLYRSRKQLKINDEHGGAILIGKGCEQPTISLEGIRAQWAWVDEPPKRGHWDALRSRVSMDQGPLWVTLTPVGRPVEWLRDIVEGDGKDAPLEPDWDQVVAELNYANAPHRDPASIDIQIAETPEWERDQRIMAKWEGVATGRRIPGFTDVCIPQDAEIPEMVAMGIGIDHGERPGSAVAVLVGWTGDALWVLDEWQSNTHTSIPSEVSDLLEMIRGWGLEPIHITTWVGDVNSAGIAASGGSVNDLLADEMKRQCGHRPSIQKPHKNRGSIMSRAFMLSSAFQQATAHVLPGCGSLIRSLRYWEGKDDDLKHTIDALGYVAERWLTRPDSPVGKVRYR